MPGDLVRLASDPDVIGLVLKIRHNGGSIPDYRSPSYIMVFFPGFHGIERTASKQWWYYKNDLEVIHEINMS